MGFLEGGHPLPWEESRRAIKYVRDHGIEQFLKVYDKVKHVSNDDLLWGDEVEYMVLRLKEGQSSEVKLSLRGAQIMSELVAKENNSQAEAQRQETCHWVPEFGAWMVEGTPGAPYSGFANDLLRVERNMRTRRARLLAALQPDEILPTVPAFPMMGVGQFTDPPHPPGGPTSESFFVPDAVINPHPRFGGLVRNIRQRRGEKVDIRMPRFKDTHTPAGTPAGGPPPKSLEEALKMDEVYMDAMAFGMGCCCLQARRSEPAPPPRPRPARRPSTGSAGQLRSVGQLRSAGRAGDLPGARRARVAPPVRPPRRALAHHARPHRRLAHRSR